MADSKKAKQAQSEAAKQEQSETKQAQSEAKKATQMETLKQVLNYKGEVLPTKKEKVEGGEK